MSEVWGETIERRASGIPFLVYTPRRRQVHELLFDATRWTERIHLVQGDRRLTFGDVFERVDDVAARFRDLGVAPGDRVLLLAPNSIEWVLAMWAGFRLGAVVSLGNSWWGPADVTRAVGLVDPALVVADGRRLTLVPEGRTVIDIASIADIPSGRADRVAVPEPVPGEEDDPAVVIFTAGTTGSPKPVVLAHRSVLSNLHNLLAVSGRLPHQVDPARPPAVVLQSGPLFHIGGFQSLLLALLGGSTVVFLRDRFDPAEVLKLIERERVTVWGAVPTMTTRALEHPAVDSTDLSSVRSVSMGGAPVQPQLLERLRERLPNARRGLSTIYGMTETGGTVATASGAVMAEHPQTSGRPLPVVELRIDSPDDTGSGEIVVRTPGQLLGYWGEKGADLLDDDNFVHTGDLGRLDDGLLYVTGRVKDLIIRGGENIAPAHVEGALLSHPAVRNAAVIGRPDADLGERVAAVVQLAGDATVTSDELATHIGPMLARFEMPSQWWLSSEPIPMTDAGKTDKLTIAATWPAD